MTTPSDPQQNLQNLSDEYQKLQTDLQPLIASLRRLESQFQENISVQKEFSNLSDDSKIYKLVGPVLLKQEKAEAESAVEGRLGWIEGEMSVPSFLVCTGNFTGAEWWCGAVGGFVLANSKQDREILRKGI
ncbi:MAG: hypothetical protein L6R37_000716 [Teloschistes peruensis]|nr:MAG: hypothetical protein L6R37_000716 [Teloschistes peruensis]